MLGFTERQLMELLKKLDIPEEQKEAIAHIVALNNQEIDMQLERRVLSVMENKVKNDRRVSFE